MQQKTMNVMTKNIRSNNATMNQINKQANAMNKETDANQKMKTSAE